jgi:ATP-dependent DNA ligase
MLLDLGAVLAVAQPRSTQMPSSSVRRWLHGLQVMSWPSTRLADVFDDGHVLFDAVVEHGLEGIVAKRRNGLYRPGFRGWTKIKNPGYWRRESEIAQMQRSRERRTPVVGV